MSEAVIGRPVDRVDGSLKVSGGARFAAEFHPSGAAYAVMVQSTVPNGRITRIVAGEVRKMPGVLAVLTPDNAPALPKKGRAAVNPPAGRVLSLLQDHEVHYNGQPIAVVVAEQFEQAVEAAARVKVSYAARSAKLAFEKAKAGAYKPKQLTHGKPDSSWGSAEAGLRASEARVEQVYTTPMEHHNPMELHATVAHWEGDRLTLYDATQYVSGVRETTAKALGIPAEKVRVICPFVGGGFGAKGSVWSHVILAAMAAREVGRPVKLVVTRPQMFGPVGGRPQTEQRVLLGARRDGRLALIRHEVISHTSVMEDYAEAATQPTRALYAAPNGVTTQRLVQLNVGVPTFQRAPGEATGTFAIESAMDELARELRIDPVELRLRNYPEVEPATGRRWSSNRVRECHRLAAERFGWSRRNAEPRSMRDGRWLVGWGMATATYPAHRMPATASARLLRDGSVIVQSGTQDLGTGTYTIMAQIAAETLGVPLSRVRFELGDTTMPKAPVSGGSMTAASVGPAVQNACRALRDKVMALAAGDAASPLHGQDASRMDLRDGWILVANDGGRRENVESLMDRTGAVLEARGEAAPGKEEEEYASRSFGSVFIEVRVHESLGTVRVPRIVSAYSVGRLMNARLAASQMKGGIVWGVGMALFEKSDLDEHYGRFANGNLAEYHVPVNADVGEMEVHFVDENDTVFSPLGGRGIGEIGITGVPAAIANAVWHATGRRIRDLPITLDKLL